MTDENTSNEGGVSEWASKYHEQVELNEKLVKEKDSVHQLFEAKTKHWENALRDANLISESLQRKVDEHEVRKQDYDAKLSECERALLELSTMLQKVSQANEGLEAQNKQLKVSYEEEKKLHNEMRNECESMRSRLGPLSELERVHKEKGMPGLQAEIKELQSQLSGARQNVETLERQVKSYKEFQKENARLEEMLAKLRADYENELSKREKKLGKLAQQSEYAQFHTVSAGTELQELHERIEYDLIEAEDRQEEMQNKIDVATRRADDLHVKLNELTTKYTEEVALHTLTRGELEVRSKALDEKSEQARKYFEECAALKYANEIKTNRIASLEELLSDTQTSLEQERVHASQLEQQNRTWDSHSKALQNEIQDLQKKINEETLAKKLLQETQKRAESTHAQEMYELNVAKDELEKNVIDLHRTISEVQRDNSDLKRRYDQIYESYRDVQKQWDTLSAVRDETEKAELREMREKYSGLLDKLQAANEDKEQLQVDNTLASNDVKTLNETVVRLSLQLAESKAKEVKMMEAYRPFHRHPSRPDMIMRIHSPDSKILPNVNAPNSNGNNPNRQESRRPSLTDPPFLRRGSFGMISRSNSQVLSGPIADQAAIDALMQAESLIAELQKKLTTKKAIIKKLKESNNELSHRLAIATADLEESLDTGKQLDAECTLLQQALKRKSTGGDAFSDVMAGSPKNRKYAEGLQQQLESEKVISQAQIERLTHQVSILNAEVEVQKASLVETTRQRDDAVILVDDLRNYVSMLKTQLQESKTDRRETQDELKTSKATLQICEREKEEYVNLFLSLRNENLLLLEKATQKMASVQVLCRISGDPNTPMALTGSNGSGTHDVFRAAPPFLEYKSMRYTFDSVLNTNCTQSDVYSHIESSVKRMARGGQVCVLSYGASTSGKTNSLLGSMRDANEDAAMGILPRALMSLFNEISVDSYADPDVTYSVSIGAVAVTSEKVLDLLPDAVVSTIEEHIDSNVGPDSPGTRFSIKPLDADYAFPEVSIDQGMRSMHKNVRFGASLGNESRSPDHGSHFDHHSPHRSVGTTMSAWPVASMEEVAPLVMHCYTYIARIKAEVAKRMTVDNDASASVDGHMEAPHLVLEVRVTRSDTRNGGSKVTGVGSFVDLSSSNRPKPPGNYLGVRMRNAYNRDGSGVYRLNKTLRGSDTERSLAMNKNKTFSTLADVLVGIKEESYRNLGTDMNSTSPGVYAPCRRSPLTRVLHEVLSPKANTFLIAHVLEPSRAALIRAEGMNENDETVMAESSAWDYYATAAIHEENVATLQFAMRCRDSNIENVL